MSDTICSPLLPHSASWVAFITLIPNNVIQFGAITLTILITVTHLINECRPQSVNQRVEKALREVEGKFHDAVGRHLFQESGNSLSIEVKLRKIQLRAANLREITLRTSLFPWREFKQVAQGHSFHLLTCLREVRALEVELEIAKAEEEQRRFQS